MHQLNTQNPISINILDSKILAGEIAPSINGRAAVIRRVTRLGVIALD